MKIRITILLLLLTTLACSRSAQVTPGAGNAAANDTQITSGGMTRTFILHVPPSYDGSPLPLVLNFHGYTSNAHEQENLTGMSPKADTAGFIVAYPNGIDSTWFTGPGADGQADLQFVRDLIAYIESKYAIDPKRIYATGISNGGGMTDRVGCNMADLIAAIAPDSGAYNFWRDCNPTRPMPVLAFHGLDDNVVPYEGGTPEIMEPPIEDWAAAWAKRNECATEPTLNTSIATVTVRTWSSCSEGADVILYTLANHGHSWPGSAIMPRSITSQAVNATDLMWEFFMAHPMP